MVLPYERLAMKNEPIPDGLDLTDQKMYLSLAILYLRYHAGRVSRETAAEEKKKLMRSYLAEKKEVERVRQIACLWKRIEIPAREYVFDSTKENADKFYAAVYGLPENWRCNRIDQSCGGDAHVKLD